MREARGETRLEMVNTVRRALGLPLLAELTFIGENGTLLVTKKGDWKGGRN